MPIIDIMQSQKNQVLQIIKKMELDPFDFEWGKCSSEFGQQVTRPCLKYKDTKFFFIFDTYLEGEPYAIYSPGKEKIIDKEFPGSWDGQLKNVWNWLHYLKREINEPDYWAQLSKFQLRGAVSLAPEVENLPFTVQEVKQVTSGVNRIREYLKTEFVGIESDHKLINEKLDYLIDAVNRQGRKDWIHTCIGVLVTVGTAIGLKPEQFSRMFQLLKEAVSGVVRLLKP